MRWPHIFPQQVFFCGLLLTLVIHCVFSCSVPLNCSLLDVTTGLPLCYFPFFFLRFIVPGAAAALINQDPFLIVLFLLYFVALFSFSSVDHHFRPFGWFFNFLIWVFLCSFCLFVCFCFVLLVFVCFSFFSLFLFFVLFGLVYFFGFAW